MLLAQHTKPLLKKDNVGTMTEKKPHDEVLDLLLPDELTALEQLWGTDLYYPYWYRLVNKYTEIYNGLED